MVKEMKWFLEEVLKVDDVIYEIPAILITDDARFI